jgi:polyisoprenoid-binding protein YceI
MSKYVIDPLHSEIEFKIKHLMISTVNGRFMDFDASMEADKADFSDAVVEFATKVSSISTGVVDRDNHLKTVDFFDAEAFPLITFKSTEMSGACSPFTMKGDMTIRDQTKPIQLQVVYNGYDTDPWGNTKYGFELSGVLSRKEFGLTFNAKSGAGNALVDDSVKLIISVQMVKKAE